MLAIQHAVGHVARHVNDLQTDEPVQVWVPPVGSDDDRVRGSRVERDVFKMDVTVDPMILMAASPLPVSRTVISTTLPWKAVRSQVGGSESTSATNSNAPMSQAGPWGRDTPRWSVVSGSPDASVQSPIGTASIAGLLGSSACVSVGPPLSCKGPTKGSIGLSSVPTRSLAAAANSQSGTSPFRLLPKEVIARPAQSGRSLP